MSGYDREYEAFRIFEQVRDEEKPNDWSEPAEQARKAVRSLNEEAPYYEIEYDSCPLPGVGRFVQKSQKVNAPVRDEIRERFDRMRDIARKNQYLYYENSRFYDKRIRQENSKIFYEQGKFMEDFEDEYEKEVPFSAYFPSYQMMGYDQLRTYFTWRTRLRRGEIRETSTSFLFLYLYELINQIGVEDAQDGAYRLLDFWLVVRERQGAVGKYVLRWLKDYHIFYELPWSFREFVDKNNLGACYPELSDAEDCFDRLVAISRYDIRKSKFYGEEREQLIKDCFYSVFGCLEQIFEEKGLDLEELIFQPAGNMPVWTPFKDALFYPSAVQRDRRVEISQKEIYLCRGGSWTFNTTLITESGRRLVGFIMKQMEAVLRRAVHYKYKLSGGSLDPALTQTLTRVGIDLEAAVSEATLAFYREATKTVVEVDPGRLERIRREALMTQERLVVPEETPFLRNTETMEKKISFAGETELPEEKTPFSGGQEPQTEKIFSAGAEKAGITPAPAFPESDVANTDDPWQELKNVLTTTETEALLLIWKKEGDLKRLADSHGVMLEVLAEGINEKAMDCVGDTLLDEEYGIYEDYLEQVKVLLE